ncbi:hypothetical protein [Marixanthomonas ophiurae]|uniref:Uncharacterized protein n=1 Tax=Marixanthomonas ophiurae TaxID=387659 RepID=A0A3E1Q9F0_9FLAO|nr:hypothetical protein [Marixanthomonas ophiurae]RFN58752.1 hypothetical protein DZ858_01330 [Marixanthomonas ophiurae]
MKPIFTFKCCVLLSILFISVPLFAQVGINTTTPNGILDVNSSNTGVVLPRVALTATNVMAPAINPKTGVTNIPAGTVVYNTNNTTNGVNDVYKGIYVWNGTRWINQFPLKHSEIFKQTGHERTRSNQGYKNIDNLVNKTFKAKYSGTYKIELSVNYGGGYVDSNYDINVATQKGNFRLTYESESGTKNKIIPAKAISTDGNTQFYLIWEQHKVVYYETLRAGQEYDFSLKFDQSDSPEFVGNGNSGSGLGYIGYDIPCSVEFTYLGS